MMTSRPLLLAAVVPGLLLTACGDKSESGKTEGSSAPKVSAPAPSEMAATTAVATVDGQTITYGELSSDKDFAAQMSKYMTDMAQRKYQLQRSAINELVDTRLLEMEARSAGKSVEDFLKESVAGKVTPPTDEDLNQLYTRGRRRFKGSFEEEKENVRTVYIQQQETRVKQQILKDLRDRHQVEVSLPYPELPRIDVSADDDPFKGGANAPITIVEFSEFQCPYCSRAQVTLKEIEETYGDQIKLVFRDFPLDFHQNAQKAAEASGCAGEQDKFWEMHDKLFANQRALEVDAMKGYAAELGLDTTKFNECLDSGRRAAEVAKDTEDGKAAGVTGTPAFFINGQMVAGALPVETFRSILDAELIRKGLTPPPKKVKTETAPAAVTTGGAVPAAPAAPGHEGHGH